MLVVLQVVATVVMYADNVLKGFATSFSVVLSCVISSILLNDQSMNSCFVCGAVIVVSSALVYSLYPITNTKAKSEAVGPDPVTPSKSQDIGEVLSIYVDKSRECLSLEQRQSAKKKAIDSPLSPMTV